MLASLSESDQERVSGSECSVHYILCALRSDLRISEDMDNELRLLEGDSLLVILWHEVRILT